MHTPEIIDSIRLLLDGRVAGVSSEVLALEYAKQCREVNERLGKIGLMLESGGEIQALQMAEQSPRVVDLALALSFGGESAWQEFCRDHGHEVAPLVDARTLETLLEIQSKGIASNHPLYKDYRTAISKRDDIQALNLIRVIARMNPGDENAAKELKRLQRKALQAALTHLKANLQAGDEELMEAMDKVEESGSVEDYESQPEWQQALALRTRIRRAEAWQRMPEALAEAERELQEGQWRHAALLHGEYANLVATYGQQAAMADTLDQRARAIGEELGKHRAEAERQAGVRQLLAEMGRIADDVEIRSVTPMGLTADFAGPLAEDLTRKMRQLQTLRGEFPENQRRRVETAHGLLNQTLEKSKRGSRIRMVAMISAAVILLLAAAAVGALAFRASAQAGHLASLRSEKASAGLRELVGRIKDEEPLLLRFPGLAAEMAQATKWLETIDAKQVIVEAELTSLEEQRRNHFDGMESPELFAKLRETGALLSELPADLVADADSRLTLLRNDGERVLGKRQENNDRKARDMVARWTATLEKVDPAGAASEAGKMIESAPQELGPFLKLAELEHPSLQLPAASAAMVADIDARILGVRKRVQAAEAALAAIESATTPDEYREALKSLAATSFGEGAAAQRVADAWLDDERTKAHLVFRGDLAALKLSANDDLFSAAMPEAAIAADREVISELTSSTVLNELWILEWESADKSKHKYLSKGQITFDTQGGWEGTIARYPKWKSSRLNFEKTKILAYKISNNRPTATSEMMSRLNLIKLLDDTGTRFKSSVLPLLDSVANDKSAHPLAKAFVYGRLLKLLRNHEKEAWGLHYCPGLIDDMNAYEELAMKAPLNEQSWLVDGNDDSIRQWEAFFSFRGERSSFSQLRKTRTAAIEVSRNPLQLAGRIPADGTHSFSPHANQRLVLAICGNGDEAAKLEICGIVDKDGKWITPEPSILPFSPLLSIDLTEDSQTFLLSIHQSKPPGETTPSNP